MVIILAGITDVYLGYLYLIVLMVSDILVNPFLRKLILLVMNSGQNIINSLLYSAQKASKLSSLWMYQSTLRNIKLFQVVNS